MFKIIELGYEVPNTGEQRVSILDDSLIKVASNDIREQWHTMERKPDTAYLHVIAMTDSEKYGCNRNGDYFKGKDLKNWYKTFVTDAHVFLHHINKDPKKSIGKPIFAFYNDTMHRVELILSIDKKNHRAKDTIAKIKSGEQIYVSMGVQVDSDTCSVCNNVAKTRAQYCKCLKYNMRKILPDGRQVSAINNPPFKFFDMSIVRKAADPIAWALEKAASKTNDSEEFYGLSSDTGELYELSKLALDGLGKLSEEIKKIEGDIVSVKDEDGDTDTLPKRKDLGIKHLYYPQLEGKDFDELNLSPGGTLKAFLASGIAPSMGECAHISHRFMTGESPSNDIVSKMLEALPQAIKVLKEKPLSVPKIIQEIMDSADDDELAKPTVIIRITKVMKPVKEARAILIKQADTGQELKKIAALPQLSALEAQPDLAGWRQLFETAEARGPWGPASHKTLNVTDSISGKQLTTTGRSIGAAQEARAAAQVIKNIAGGALGIAAISSLLSNKDLMLKLFQAIPLGLLAAAIFSSKSGSKTTVTSQEGIEIPITTLFHEKRAGKFWGTAVKEVAKKGAKGAKGAKKSKQLTPQDIATVMGMTVPGVLGLDYLVNKHLRYKGHPDPSREMGGVGKTLYNLGGAAVEHPFLSTALGGILAGLGGRAAFKGKIPKV